jgi:hypothetical protein
MPIDGGMGDADPLGEFARLPAETMFGKEADRLLENDLAPVFAARLLSGRFLTFTAFALRIVARIRSLFVFINIFKLLL